MPDDAADPVAELDEAAWALAAVIATYREAGTSSLAEALAADPDRAAVLAAAGLLRPDGAGFAAHPAVPDGPVAGNAAAARLSSLRQAAAVAAGEPAGGWAAQPDDVLLAQGHASAATGHAVATRLVPVLPGLADRLAVPGSRVLDVGSGVAALSLALVRALPRVRVTAVDVLDRAIRLARAELAQAGPVADRVELRRQDVTELREPDTYQLIWLPVPFLSAATLCTALPHLVSALAPGGWLVAGTNPVPSGALAAAVARWNAARNGGSSPAADRLAAVLRAAGLDDVQQHPTVPGGPILVTAHRPS